MKTTFSGEMDVLSRYRHGSSGNVFQLRMNNGKPQIAVYLSGGYSHRLSTATINDNAWHHIAGVWEPGSRLDIYVDGVKSNDALYNSGSGVLSTIEQASTVPISIGASEYPAGTYTWNFRGLVDDVRYSKVARYSANFTPSTSLSSDSDTVGLWKFDEGTGGTTATQGQITSNATLTNGPIWVGP